MFFLLFFVCNWMNLRDPAAVGTSPCWVCWWRISPRIVRLLWKMRQKIQGDVRDFVNSFNSLILFERWVVASRSPIFPNRWYPKIKTTTTLPKTDSPTKKLAFRKENLIFQPSIFRGSGYVSSRKGIFQWFWDSGSFQGLLPSFKTNSKPFPAFFGTFPDELESYWGTRLLTHSEAEKCCEKAGSGLIVVSLPSFTMRTRTGSSPYRLQHLR